MGSAFHGLLLFIRFRSDEWRGNFNLPTQILVLFILLLNTKGFCQGFFNHNWDTWISELSTTGCDSSAVLVLDALLGHLPAAQSDKILCSIPWTPLEGHPNMGTDRTRRQRLPKLQCRHGCGPHITALSPSTTEAPSLRQEGDVHLWHPETPPSNTHQHKHTPNIHDLLRNLLWAQSSPCDFVFHKGHRTRFENSMLLNVGSKHLVLARNALYKKLSSLHIVTLWTFSVFLFSFLWSAIYITDSGISSGKLRTHRSHRLNVSLLRKRMEEKLPKN